MQLSHAGQIVWDCWNNLLNHYSHVSLYAFVAMPDHVHGIIVLDTSQPTAQRHGLPEIVRALKSFSARRINEAQGTPGVPVWQRSYHERIVRDERTLHQMRAYIMTNPARWGGTM